MGRVKTSSRYMASGSACFSPSAKEALGAVGVSSRSHFSNASSKSRAISARTFCAWVCPYHLLAEWAEKLHLYLAARKLVKRIPVEGKPGNIQITQDDAAMIMVNGYKGNAQVIDSKTGEVKHEIENAGGGLITVVEPM